MASGDWGWLRWYKKPSYVDVHKFAASINEAASSKDESDARTRIPGPRCSSEIPSKLDLEKILKNRTCMDPPRLALLLSPTDPGHRQPIVSL